MRSERVTKGLKHPARLAMALLVTPKYGEGGYAVTEEGVERINASQRRRYKIYFNLALFVYAAVIK